MTPHYLQAGDLPTRRRLLMNCALARAVWGDLAAPARRLVQEAELAADAPDGPAAVGAAQSWRRAHDECRAVPAPQGFLCGLWPSLGDHPDIMLRGVAAVAGPPPDYRPLAYQRWTLNGLYFPDGPSTAVFRARLTPVVEDFLVLPPPPWGVEPHMQTADVVATALAAYDSGEAAGDGALDPVALSVAADAATDAGWPEAVCRHLRGPGPHFCGCWALDMLFGLPLGQSPYEWVSVFPEWR